MADITFDTLSDATTVGTGTATDGTGNFDELMQVVTLHLEKQFTDGRITGTDYANVYLGALQSTLDQAVGFTLGMNKSNADANLVGKQEDLVDEQILTEKKNTDLVEAQGDKVDADKLLVDANELLVDATKLKVDEEADLITQKIRTEYAQTGTTSVNTVPVTGSVLGKQISLIANQAATEEKKAADLEADTSLKGSQELKIDAEELLVDAQELKVDAEKELLNQKKVTEWAQTKLTTSSGTIAGVIGEQIDLFEQQAKGFKWNADAKYLKSLLDAYAINVSVSKDNDTATKLLQGGDSDIGIDKIIDDMKPTG